MHDSSDSTDRSLDEHLLFAIAFLGFVGAMGGVVLSSPGLACTGAATSLLALGCFLRR
jgi:hypothetical protein